MARKQRIGSPDGIAVGVSQSLTPFLTALPHLEDPEALLSDIRSLIQSGWLSNRGPQVHRFERELRHFLEISNLSLVTCANATLGMEVLLNVLGLKGEIIVPSFTFVSTLHSVVRSGLTPVFADIDPLTLCLSPNSVEKVLSKKTCAIIPVHVYGNVGDISYFESLRKLGIKILYDAAHAFGVKHNGQRVGAFGDAEVFSFHATKILSSCEGGMVTSLDSDLIKRIQLASNFGIQNETEVTCVGTNAKMSEVHALFGIHSLRHIETELNIRREIVTQYKNALKNKEGIQTLNLSPGTIGNGQHFPILLSTEAARDKAYSKLRAEKMIVRKYFYPPVHQLAPYRQIQSIPLPQTESISQRVLCLPIHGGLTPDDVDQVIDRICHCEA